MSRLLLVLSILLFSGSASVADQRDARLEPLFTALKSSSAQEAPFIERQIWSIWSRHGGDDEINMRFQRGVVLMNSGQIDRAIGIFSRIVEIDPDFAEAWNKRATLLYMSGDFSGSVRDIQRTLSLEPRHFGALSGLGLIYSELDSTEGAIKAFTAALEINPHMPWIEERLAVLEERRDGEAL